MVLKASAIELPGTEGLQFSPRFWLFTISLGLVWITLHPFDDLSLPSYEDVHSGREFWTYAAFTIVAAMCWLTLRRSDAVALRALAVPSNLVMLAWVAISVVASTDFLTSLKRVSLWIAVTIVSASLFLLPRGHNEFARGLAVMTVLVLALSYFGVFFTPDVAIHHAGDVVEARLNGDWRGLYEHKNIASGMCAVFVFIGFYLWSAGRMRSGAVIGISAAIFLAQTHGKSSIILCVAAIVVPLVVERRIRSNWTQHIALLTPLVVLLLIGVGSTLSPRVAGLFGALTADESFTGREDIWRFAASKIIERPLWGYGPGAFWGGDAVRFDGADPTIWARAVAHAHNSFLDTALAMGIPGLVLALWALVLQPLRDYRAASLRDADGTIRILMLRIWIFGLYLSAFDTIFFQQSDPIWIMFLFAIFSLRYLACFKVAL